MAYRNVKKPLQLVKDVAQSIDDAEKKQYADLQENAKTHRDWLLNRFQKYKRRIRADYEIRKEKEDIIASVNSLIVKDLKKQLQDRGENCIGKKDVLRSRLLNVMMQELEASKKLVEPKSVQKKSAREIPGAHVSKTTSVSRVIATEPQSEESNNNANLSVAERHDAPVCPETVVNLATNKEKKADNKMDVDEVFTHPDNKASTIVEPSNNKSFQSDHAEPDPLCDAEKDGKDVKMKDYSPPGSKPAYSCTADSTDRATETVSDESSRKRERSPLKPVACSNLEKPARSPVRKYAKFSPMSTSNHGKIPAEAIVLPKLSSSRSHSPKKLDVGRNIAGLSTNSYSLSKSSSKDSGTSGTKYFSGSSTMKSESMKAKLKARNERMNGILGKTPQFSQPLATPSEYATSGSSLVKSATHSGSTKHRLVEQIRAKAFAEKRIQTETKMNKPQTSKIPVTGMSSTAKSPYSSSVQKSATKRILASAKKNQLSPKIESYEMSDHGDDSDSEDEDSHREKKAYPNWADKRVLYDALLTQAKSDLDPDEIFGEVETCDLEAIFDTEKRRFKNRTSSGIWTNDRVTAAEKVAYKQSVQTARVA